MNSTKDEEREELERLVDEYKRKGGKIQQVPTGTSSNGFAFHGHRSINGKQQLYLSKRPGFHTERIKLGKEENDKWAK